MLGSAAGCVVTDPIEFERPRNSPPSFVVEQPPKLQVGDIKYVDYRDAASWRFSLRVRDPDVNQDLEVHWRIVTSDQPRPDREPTKPLPATGELIRDLDIDIESTRLRANECHRVEVAVSGSFTKPFEGEPENFTLFLERSDFDDIALFSFWIWEGGKNSNDPQKLVDTCFTTTFVPPSTSATGESGEGG